MTLRREWRRMWQRRPVVRMQWVLTSWSDVPSSLFASPLPLPFSPARLTRCSFCCILLHLALQIYRRRRVPTLLWAKTYEYTPTVLWSYSTEREYAYWCGNRKEHEGVRYAMCWGAWDLLVCDHRSLHTKYTNDVTEHSNQWYFSNRRKTGIGWVRIYTNSVNLLRGCTGRLKYL